MQKWEWSPKCLGDSLDQELTDRIFCYVVSSSSLEVNTPEVVKEAQSVDKCTRIIKEVIATDQI